MAYAALISLEHLLPSLEIPCCPEIIESLNQDVKHLQKLFRGLEVDIDSTRWKAMESGIREAAYRLEDVLESSALHLSSSRHDLSQPELPDGVVLLGNKVKEEIDFFTESVKKTLEEHYYKVDQLPSEEDGTSRTEDDFDHGNDQSKMVGLEDEVSGIKNLLINRLSSELKVFVIEGMAGIGKTTLARQVYEHPSISSTFDCRLWVKVGTKCQMKEIMLGILAKLNLDNIDEIHETELLDYVRRSLRDRKYLVVLDDVWSKEICYELELLFPCNLNGSGILLTTRIQDVARYDDSNHRIRKSFLDKEDSWRLLRGKVFGEEESCPPQLEEVGKRIAEKCEGLPLAIIAVAKHLCIADKTPEYWKVAEDEIPAIFSADEVMSKKLMLSYNHLPQHLKACFLYLGVFPHGYRIPVSKLIKMWCAEGFLDRHKWNSLEGTAMECLLGLVNTYVVLISAFSSSLKIKTCKVHSVFWHLCTKQADEEKLFHIMNSNANQHIERQRRLCIHNNILFGIKDVRKSMASVSNARSLLCTGPHHEYPVPKCLCFSLLKVLDAATIRFYEFPNEVVELIFLRYLAFTYNGKLPASISKLQNLEYLIVQQYLSILSFEACRPYLPMEIWDMRKLSHLQVMGSDLPDPSPDSVPLRRLSTLLGISASSCTKKVFGKIPNLKRLGIQVELALDVPTKPLCCFDHLPYRLESLKCVIVNPKVVVAERLPVSIFELRYLRKVTLTGLGLPWHDMSSFGKLPRLEVLKLRCNACRGPVWKSDEVRFRGLRYLLLEDVDLEKWDADCFSFQMLQYLSIRHCYKLKKIPLEIGKTIQFRGPPTLKGIELVDCGESVVASAKQIVDEQVKLGNKLLQVYVKSSADDRKLK
ncbi:putative late blight resistance protein homolog R1B-16 [Sesamum indicum]|uniref:Late blight resistance protein homolog R1B-16 n=1 Tax=Sesamum indicum TaxID=4182 RepID=A0A6I9TM63_SESIN|nr:putative late blight resistance protein homolog R1B-16 [Sesamum indicum]